VNLLSLSHFEAQFDWLRVIWETAIIFLPTEPTKKEEKKNQKYSSPLISFSFAFLFFVSFS
jgi:hypothetical protein